MIICTRCEALVAAPSPCPSCGRSAGASPRPDAQPERLRTGTVVGGFRIESLLDQHDRRRVYVARGPRGGTCVLKELCGEGASERRQRDLAAQHERESSVLARLSLAGVPRLLASFREAGRLYLAIERLPGVSLWDVLDGVPLPEREAVEIVERLAGILAGIHAARPAVFHLDLSPGNVLAARQGRSEPATVSLIDFGDARSPGTPAIRLFTQGFSPPERHFSPEGEGAAGDLYGLGALLHFLVSGRDPASFPPFLLPPARELAPAISARTEALCLWLVQPDPAARPRDAWTALGAIRGTERIPDAASLRKAIERFEPESLRVLERRAGMRRRPPEALALTRALVGRGHARAARRVLLDTLETLRVEPERRRRSDPAATLAALAELYLVDADAERALAACEEARAFACGESQVDVVAEKAAQLLASARSREADPVQRSAVALDPRSP